MTEFECFLREREEFVLFLEMLDFEKAVSFCQKQNATLARVSNQGEFDFVRKLVEDLEVESFWLGMLYMFLGLTCLQHSFF